MGFKRITEIFFPPSKPAEPVPITPAQQTPPEPAPAPTPPTADMSAVMREMGKRGAKARAAKRKANPPPGTPAEALKPS